MKPSDFVSDLQTGCFSTIHFSVPQSKVLKIYKAFEDVCHLTEEAPEEVADIDHWMERFAKEADNPVANGKIKLKNLDKNLFALSSSLTTGIKEFDVMSYQYVPGIYEFISQNAVKKTSKGIQFLKLMDECHRLVEKKMEPILSVVREKGPCGTMLKVWRHRPVKGQHCFHPVHQDRSIFTILLHNTKPQTLRLFTPLKDGSYYPVPSDFPLMISGAFAKQYFGLEAIPHMVEKSEDIQNRYSLIFFITDPKKW